MFTSREHRLVLPAILGLLLACVLALGVQAPSYAATYPTLSTGPTGANVTSLRIS